MENFFPFEKNPKICVAVSGGADSLALTLLTNYWVKKFNGSVIGVTIDHSLRDNSADEAQHVSKELEKFDINHQIIKYDGPKPKTRIQEIARKYRYQLLGDFCKRKNIYHLLVGHHSLDQKETCLMRSWRDSGFIGLAGMSAIIEFNSHRLLRPMLNIDPKELKKYLSDRQVIWVEDISNKNNFYLRVRAREHLVKNSWNLNRTFAKKRTGNTQLDIIITFGYFPVSLYEPGNTQKEESIAEKFLEGGDIFMNTADYIFYVTKGGGKNGLSTWSSC